MVTQTTLAISRTDCHGQRYDGPPTCEHDRNRVRSQQSAIPRIIRFGSVMSRSQVHAHSLDAMDKIENDRTSWLELQKKHFVYAMAAQVKRTSNTGDAFERKPSEAMKMRGSQAHFYGVSCYLFPFIRAHRSILDESFGTMHSPRLCLLP